MSNRVVLPPDIDLAIHYGQAVGPDDVVVQDKHLFVDLRPEGMGLGEEDPKGWVSACLASYASHSDADDVERRLRHCYQAGLQHATEALQEVLQDCSLLADERAVVEAVVTQHRRLCASKYHPLYAQPVDVGISDTQIKVQRALAGEANFLMYNRDRSIMLEAPIAKHTELATLMAGYDKRYFTSHVNDAGELSLDEVVEDADW